VPAWHNPGMSELPSSPLRIGADAPAFDLRRTFKESVSLAELLEKGPVAVVFYVFDFGDI
jgi:peroxiredoxin